MALPSFCRKGVTVERARYVTERGTQVCDWDDPERHVIEGCDAQPRSSSTQWNDPAQAETVRLTLRLPPDSDIRAGDRVVVDGVRYAVDGAPHVWQSPSGRVSHVECQLIDWRG